MEIGPRAAEPANSRLMSGKLHHSPLTKFSPTFRLQFRAHVVGKWQVGKSQFVAHMIYGYLGISQT